LKPIIKLSANNRTFKIALLVVSLFWGFTANAQVASQPYRWKNVQIRGGGFVDGLVYHPKEKDLLYCRTDMGGAYKWNKDIKAWEPLLDWISYKDYNLVGVESIALDPSDPNMLYMACGTYTSLTGPNAVMISDNRGKTFKRVDVPFHMGGNENGRGNGERMAVDPNNGNILYMGTRLDGLWRSEDKAATWNRVTGISEKAMQPDTPGMTAQGRRRMRPNGIIFVIFDPNSKMNGRSAVIYAGISQKGKENLYRSTDGGANWLPIPGEPTANMPTHAVLAGDGILYITYGNTPGPTPMTDGAVYAFNTKKQSWKDITPVKPQPDTKHAFGYAAVAIDPQHPQSLIVSTFHKAGGDDIFRSIDGGSTWKPVFGGGGKFDYRIAPYVSHTGIHWLFDMEIDPFNPNHAIFTTGYGLHDTFDLTDVDRDKPTTWSVMNTGIEETVGLELLSPPKGVPLISAIGDYGGFVHQNLDKPSPEGNFLNPHFGNTDGVSCAWQNSKVIVRVGEASTQVGGGNIGYSLNGGQSWQPTSATPQPDSHGGSIAVSANGDSWIWTPANSIPYVTFNNGESWTAITNLPARTRVVADAVNPAKFYAMALFDGSLFTSTDSGKTFAQQKLMLPNPLPQRGFRGDTRGGQDRLYTTPGNEGDLWLPLFDGLYHGAAGQEFKQVGKVQEIHAFGFGKAAPASNYPALYLVGTIDGVDGIFRSDNKGENWVRINDDQHRWGLVLQITGDPKKYGRVYVGTHGRGIFYGDIN